MDKTVWFDITNTPQVHFLLAIQEMIGDHFGEPEFTARDFSETTALLSKHVRGNNLHIVNSPYRSSKAGKLTSLLSRFNGLRKLNISYDLSISCGSESAIWNSWLIGKKSIAFGDNDTAKQWTYSRFVSFAFFPDAIDTGVLERQGLKGKLWQYPGYKEDIYISYFKPDMGFVNLLPFDNYVVVRPENIHANYLSNEKAGTIIPSLLSRLSSAGYTIVYLPRYPSDKVYAEGMKNVFIPPLPLNGLDLCYNADAVLTGAGTLAREAACLGIPAFSFYAGKNLLAVDKKLISEKKMIHTRDVGTLMSELASSSRTEADTTRSVLVREALKEKLLSIIKGFDI